MTPEERQILIQTNRLVEENNKMLRKMRRAAIWGRVVHFLYWAVIIGASLGAYYYIQPYIDQIMGIYGGFKEGAGSVSELLQGVGR